MKSTPIFETMKDNAWFSWFPFLAVFILAGACSYSFQASGVFTLSAVILTYILVPTLELILRPKTKSIRPDLLEKLRNSRTYDLVLYLVVPVQYLLLFQFLNRVTSVQNTWFELAIMTFSMGIACGVLGINVAHELGHRTKKYEQNFASALLLTSLYMHFTIEHNEGHHKNVGTTDDPATARLNESVYAFWFRCIPNTIRSAWNIEKKRLKRKKAGTWSWYNRMIQYAIIQVGFIVIMGALFGTVGAIFFVAAAIVGILHLETVNYIEHYGLSRKKVSERRYENVMPWHSWNSNRLAGRFILFELTLHSDHHHKVHKKYQELEALEDAPELPTGYPGSMILSLFPPLWYKVMNPLALKSLERAS